VRRFRDTDRAVSLEERPRLAARMKADLLGSVHFNAAASTRPSGIETTALGAAYLAGITAGLYGTIDEVAAGNRIISSFRPVMNETERTRQKELWKKAVNKLL
jgi:glycerol kinase